MLFLLWNIHIPLRRNVALFHLKQTGSTLSRPEKLKLHFHWLAPKQVCREHERKETAKVCVWLTSLVILVILQGHCVTPTSNTMNSIRITQHSCHIQGGRASWPTHLSLVECWGFSQKVQADHWPKAVVSADQTIIIGRQKGAATSLQPEEEEEKKDKTSFSPVSLSCCCGNTQRITSILKTTSGCRFNTSRHCEAKLLLVCVCSPVPCQPGLVPAGPLCCFSQTALLSTLFWLRWNRMSCLQLLIPARLWKDESLDSSVSHHLQSFERLIQKKMQMWEIFTLQQILGDPERFITCLKHSRYPGPWYNLMVSWCVLQPVHSSSKKVFWVHVWDVPWPSKRRHSSKKRTLARKAGATSLIFTAKRYQVSLTVNIKCRNVTCKLGLTFCCLIDHHITIDLLRFWWKGRWLVGETPSNWMNTMVSMFFSLYQHRLLITVKGEPAVTWAVWRMDRRSWSWGHVTPAWGELCDYIHFISEQQIQWSQLLVKLVWQGVQW